MPPAPLAGPPQAVPGNLPMEDGKLAIFKKQISLARDVRKQHEPWWKANIKAYAPMPDQTPERYAQDINTNRDFTLVERKKADLFFTSPEVSLQPTPLMDGPVMVNGQPMMGPPNPQTGQPQPVMNAPSLQAHKEIVNEGLGRDGIDAKRMVHQALFDVISTSGIGWVKLGYEQFSSLVQTLDPYTGQMRDIPVPVKRQVYAHYFTPMQALIPHNFRSTEWDSAPWLGMEFTLPLTKANREKYHIPEDFEGSKSDAKSQHFDYGLKIEEGERIFTGVELEYRSVQFRDDVVHPDHLTQLVLVDGMDEPAIHQDSPHQTLDEHGCLTPDSLRGFSIHPLNVRMQTDTAYVASDCTLIRPLVNELNIYRNQSLQFRDATTLKWYYNTDTMPADALAKVVRAPIGGLVGMPPEMFIGENIKEFPQGSMPRENFTGQQGIDDDISRTSGIDASGAGVQAGPSQTATAEQIQQGNASARLKFERGVVLDWYIRFVNKYSTLVQRYLPVEDAAKIVGTQRAQAWDVWRKTVPSALAFTALPDSALMTDQAADRDAAMKEYTYFAQDPYVNREYLLRKLAIKMHYDPALLVRQPDPPKPEAAKMSLALASESLNPYMPEYTAVYQILTQQGVKNLPPPPVTPEQAMQMQAQAAQQAAEQEAALKQQGQQPHGGKVAQMESLSKHAVDQTGGTEGIGGHAGGVM